MEFVQPPSHQMLGDEHNGTDNMADADEDLEPVIYGLAPILALGSRHARFADRMLGVAAAVMAL